ncbi:MAG: hypothetical protein ACTSW4_05885 [Candidatus Ranarchaeia archaeon]
MSTATENELEKIIIEVTEKEECVLNDKNEIAEIKVDGILKVVNPSRECRIWNTEVQVKGIESTTLSEAPLAVGEVQAKADWSTEYKVTTDQPLLRLVETIDTCSAIKSMEPHWALSYNVTTQLLFTIRVSNVSDTKLTNIEVRKTFPTAFGKPVIEDPETGQANFHPKNREIVWNEFELFPNTEVELKIRAEIKPDLLEPYDAGEVTATYVAKDKMRSSIGLELYALTNALVGGTTEEDPRQPGKWICVADLLNDSTFPLKITRVSAVHSIGGDKNVVIDETPDITIAPNESFSKEFVVESPTPPVLERNIDYTVVSEAQRQVIGTIIKRAQYLPVIGIDVTKSFSPAEVDAYDKTPMTAHISVTNIGSAALNEIVFLETLPTEFKPPDSSDILLKINEQPLNEGITITTEPSDDDPSKEHRIKIRVEGLDQTIGGLQPKGVITCDYKLIAWSPQPQVEYISPLQVESNVEPPVYPGTVNLPPVKIGIRYVSRRIAVYKTVQPGKTAGEYVIPLRFINRGGVAVERIAINDIVPKGFKLVSVDPPDLKPTELELPDGIQLTWKFDRIEKGNQIAIKYTVQGTGEYIRREPQITSY